jgi:hypothetical protein
MDKNTARILGIVASTLLCGVPGVAGLCIGTLAIIGANLPDSGFTSEEVSLAAGSGFFMLCLWVVFVAIPIVTAILTREKKGTAAEEIIDVPVPDEDF